MYKYFKRLIDITLSLIAFIILIPIFIPIAIILRFTGEGYVFYKQERIGYKNRKFLIFKFATMLKDSPNLGTGSLTLKDDPRVFPFGKFLRLTKINELPQLFNILIGDMSIVGPRPQMEVDFLKFPIEVQEVIYNVKPGLSGIGSIVFRDEQKILSDSTLPPHECYIKFIAPYKGALEIWYPENMSLRTDLLIIFLTVWTILFPESKLVFKVFKSLPERNNFY